MSVTATATALDLLSSRVPLTLLFDLALGAPASEEIYALEQPARAQRTEALAS